MADENKGIKTIRRLSIIALLATATITAVAVIFGALSFTAGRWAAALAVSLAIVLLGATAIFILLAIRSLLANWESSEHVAGLLVRIESLLENQGQDIQSLAGMASLSDQAKSLIYYEKEIDALNESVHAMILKQDYKSAEALISRMESRIGMVEEVASLRGEIDSIRKATLEEKIEAAVKRIETILGRFQWAQAKRETNRLIALFPTNPQITVLPQKIIDARNARKQKLLREYSDACRVNDVERSIELLKALDKYLTPQEGSALAESARDVFKKKLHNLGVQFTIAADDQQWSKAIATGEEIIREYPNSRMSREVQEKLKLLRDYATNTDAIAPNPAAPASQPAPEEPPAH